MIMAVRVGLHFLSNITATREVYFSAETPSPSDSVPKTLRGAG
jgi:hypothetical protein